MLAALLQIIATFLNVDPEATVEVGAVMQGIITLLTSIVLGLVTWALKRLIAIDKNISRLEQWQIGHSKQDDERHEENLGKFEAIFQALNRKK
jgi:hypothetical protein